MSKTTPAGYHGYCVFDVCASIMFAEMATVASQTLAAERSVWMSSLEHELRVHAIVGDLAIPLDQ